MKAVHTFWPRGRKPGSDELVNWALSVTLAKRLFGRVELHTDSEGKRVLVDRLRLPYDEVYETLNAIPEGWNTTLWAYAKLLGYEAAAEQGDPFIHLDGDVFLFKPIRRSILDSPVFAQCFEAFTYYRASMTLLTTEERGHLLKERAWRAYNLGVVGGHDIGFFKEYVRKAKALAEILNKRSDASHLLNIVYEQAVFGKCAADRRTDVRCVLDGGYNREQATRDGFCHLIHAKRIPGTGAAVARTLAAVSGGISETLKGELPSLEVPSVEIQLPQAVRAYGFPNPANCNYNGGVVNFGGRSRLFYRTHRPILDSRHDLSRSEVWCADFDAATGETASHRKVEIHVPGYEHVEDPRPVVLSGRLHVAFTAARYPGRCECVQGLARINGSMEVDEYVPLRMRSPTEKNWQFFEHAGKTFYVYDPVGHEVCDLDGEVYRGRPVRWRFGRPAGGTPPVLVGRHFYTFFHSHTFHPRHNRAYHFGVYRFSADPPFSPDAVSLEPIATGSEADGRIGLEERMHWHPLVVFPVSASFSRGEWTIALGVNDSFVYTTTIRHEYIENKLVELPPQR